MKNLILITVFFASLTACQSDTSKQNQGSQTQTTMPMRDSMAHVQSDTMMHVHTYVCPMHPEVTSQKEGDKCPKCGMDLVHQDSE